MMTGLDYYSNGCIFKIEVVRRAPIVDVVNKALRRSGHHHVPEAY